MPDKLKNILLVFIILAGIAFFQLALLGESMFKVIEMAALGLIFVFFVIHFIYDREKGFHAHYVIPIIIIFLGVIASMIMAAYAHGQDLKTTAIAQRSMYFYVFYFFLHFMKYRFKTLERIILGMAIAYTLFFAIQFVLYPRVIFDIRISEERGTLRIFLPGLSFLLIGYFWCLNTILNKQKFVWLVPMVFFLVIVVLLGTRQILFTVLLVTIINIIFSGNIKSKLGLGLLAMLAVIPVFFLLKDVFIEMMQLSQQQAGSIENDIRVRAARFFLTDFYPNRMAYFTGNGAHSLDTAYGVMVEGLKESKGYYQSDIGIIGEFTIYGLLFVIGVLLIFVLVFIKPADKEANFIKYFFLATLIVLPLSGQEFSSPGNIIPKLIGLYMLDIAVFRLQSKKEGAHD